jgi:hypothetical protein
MGKFIVIDGLRAYTVCVMSFGVSAKKSGAEFLENFRNNRSGYCRAPSMKSWQGILHSGPI